MHGVLCCVGYVTQVASVMCACTIFANSIYIYLCISYCAYNVHVYDICIICIRILYVHVILLYVLYVHTDIICSVMLLVFCDTQYILFER